MDQTRGGLRHRNDLQGLRAVAVLLVALSHAGVSFLKGGYVGVDVFFVLSGFLITGLLLSAATKPRLKALTEFYARRARRILPAAALTLVVTDVIAYRLLNFVRAKGVLQDSLASAIFTANIHFANQGTNYFAQGQPPSPLQHFWSLAVEEQFYLFWPVILSLVLLGFALHGRLRGASRRPKVTERGTSRLLVAVIVIAVVSLAWSIHDTQANRIAAYFSTLDRAWELALGAALAIVATKFDQSSGRWRRRLPASWPTVAGWTGMLCIVAAGVAFSSTTPFPGYAALLPTVGALLVIGAGIGRRQSRFAVERVLSTLPMRFVGDRSYAFYLWHWPVLVIAALYVGHNLSVRVNLLLLLGAFLLSSFTYAVFENPVRRMRLSSPSHALLLWPVSVFAVVIVAGWGISAVNSKATRLAAVGAPQYPGLTTYVWGAGAKSSSNPLTAALAPTSGGGVLPAVVAAVKQSERGARIPAALTPSVGNLLTDRYSDPPGCTTPDGQSSGPVCSLGDPTGTKSLVVMGDSHSAMWMPAILAMAKKDGWVVHPIGKSACTPIVWWNLSNRVETGETPAECRAWYHWAIWKIQTLHPTVTMFAAGFSGVAWHLTVGASGISSLVESVKRYSKHVLVLGDTYFREGSQQQNQPVDCLLGHDASMAHCSLTPTQEFNVPGVIASAANEAGAGYIDTQGWFCYNGQCPMVIGHTIVYADNGGHITATYASELSNVFRAAFRRAIGSA